MLWMSKKARSEKPRGTHRSDGRGRTLSPGRHLLRTPFFYGCPYYESDSPRARARINTMLQSAFILTVQVLPCILLVLWGWGFDNWQAFFENPARATLAAVALAGAVAAILMKLDSNPLRKSGAPAVKETVQLGLLLLMSLALLWFLPHADRGNILTLHHEFWALSRIVIFHHRISSAPRRPEVLGKKFQRLRNPATKSSISPRRNLRPHPPSALPQPATDPDRNRVGIRQLACVANSDFGCDICF